jgi:hypothetical protein
MGKKLILLYGELTNIHNGKYQWMIDGTCTCGYRPYAQKYGYIVYLSPQKVKRDWEFSITNPGKLVHFIKKHPNAVVWAIKHAPGRDKQVLSKIKNRKLYYSCCASNMYNPHCNVSLVDTKQRLAKNAKIWFKGKDENFWRPTVDKANKEFDYLLIGKRADKNEIMFIRKLTRSIKDKRRILWIGGQKHQSKVDGLHTHHEVVYTPFSGTRFVRNNMSRAKVGILFTEHKREGFPQSLLEMTMCGVPVVYNKNAPANKHYIHSGNVVLTDREHLIGKSEALLQSYDPEICRDIAINYYSLDRSAKYLLEL